MSVYVTGDTHGPLDLDKIYNWEMTVSPNYDDVLIILGDWGAIWYNNSRDKKLIDYWDTKPYLVCFIDGNHDHHSAIATYDIIDFFGGRAHQITPNILHLMRGEVYNIQGKSIFTMGGATSIDKFWRTEGKDWWEEELPSMNEYENAHYNLEKYGYKIDYILSHCTDTHTMAAINRHFESDHLNRFLFTLKSVFKLKYKHHYFGHYHIDSKIRRKETCLYQKVVELK